jgi:large subunit ribosomal protein L10
MADRRPADKKPKGSGNPNRINRLLVKRAAADYGKLTNMVMLTNLRVSSEQNQEIRMIVREKKVKLRSIRNRLAVRAFSDLGLQDANRLFVGPTCVIDAEDPVTAAKVAVELVAKFNKSLKLTGGVLEGKVLDSKQVDVLAKSKTRPELIGDVVLMAKSPGAKIAAQLKGPGGRIAGAVKALVEKLEKSTDSQPAPEGKA